MMIKKPKISVVIPCFNASGYIIRCLKALESQTYKDFDVIMIDDCSTDDTVQVIEEYQASSSLTIHLLKNEVNSGPAKSRNCGISTSTADYICFCDSDDWYDENYLSLMYDQSKDNDADIVFCGYKLIVEGKRTIQHPLLLDKPLIHKKAVLQMGTDSLWSMMVRRTIIDHVPQPDLRNGEDMAIIPLLIVNSERFGFVKDCPYNYFCRQDSISMTPTIKVVNSLIASFEHIKNNMPKEYRTETEFIGIKNLVYGALLNLFKCEWNREKAEQILDDFERCFPEWNKNPYISSLSLFKRWFVRLSAKKLWGCVFLMCKLHAVIVK